MFPYYEIEKYSHGLYRGMVFDDLTSPEPVLLKVYEGLSYESVRDRIRDDHPDAKAASTWYEYQEFYLNQV